MAVVVKSNQPEENELICGVSNDCVVLQPAKLEPEPVNFVSVNNGLYETATELYNCQATYQQLTSCRGFPNDSQVIDGTDLSQVEVQHSEIYGSAEEFSNIEPAPTELSEHSSSTVSAHTMQDYFEIQVAEEEVVSDNWNVDHTEVVVEDSKPSVEINKSLDDVEIPLPQDQDIYSQMHPYPCDFCSRRFSKKSTLMSHMVSHQTERPHGCNLCGARYRRKCDLVNHMKIHAYPPPRTTLDEDEEDMRASDKGRRKKAQSLAPKKNSFSSDMSDPMDCKEEKKLVVGKTKLVKKSNKGMTPKYVSYVDEDMRLLSEMSRNTDVAKQVPRWPVVDQSRPYVCQHCGVGFAREKALGSHSRIHGGDSPFECDVCGEMFWDLSLMREHTRSKHPQQESAGGGDGATIYTGDERFGTFHCDTCNLSFHKLDLLKKHRKTHYVKTETIQEVGDDDHVCTVCGQFFENASELRAHAESHVQESRCLECGARFNDPSDLREHMQNMHPEDGNCMCQACGKVCKDRRGLAKHSCTQADDAARSFPCYSCNKRFHSRARLRRHMVSHRDKAVSCSDCGEEFPDGRALMSHRHSHNTSQHPPRSFPCHDCGKTFGSRSSQQIHVRIHTGERPYGCRFCWKAFADGGTLRKHERIHTGEKPYVCPVCPKAFNQRVVLREHIRAHHSSSDSKVNSSYVCKVCHYLCSSSSELCVHLVQHSDENTAKHRMPSLGPRKYKRRRKLGPAAPKASPALHYESTDSSDSAFAKKIVKKKYVYDSPPSRDLGESVVQSFENAIQNIDSLIIKSEPKKQKLDKALKKHKTKALSKLTKLARIEKRAKAAKLLNSTSYASKYVVTRPDEMKPDGQVRPRTKNVTFPTLEDSLDTILNGSDAIRNRPRTKNVNYHNMKVTKLEPATFPLTKSRSKKTKVKKTFVKKERTKSVSNEFINGVKPVDEMIDNSVSEERLETCIVDDFNIEGVHHEVKTEEIPQRLTPVMIKSEMLTCEMCGDGFIDRSELLAHIRVHI